MKITQEELKAILSYDPESGEFRYVKALPKHGISAGDAAGSDMHGYAVVRIKGFAYPLHRLAFLYMEGDLPKDCVDHIDGDKRNNRFSNLRPATKYQNSLNRGKGKFNTSGWKGVNWHKGSSKWVARITVNGKRVALGYFDDVREAAEEYMFAALKYHGDYARLE